MRTKWGNYKCLNFMRELIAIESDYYCLFLSGVNYSDLFESDTFLLTYSNGNINDIITVPHSGIVLWKATGGAVDVFMHLNSKMLLSHQIWKFI